MATLGHSVDGLQTALDGLKSSASAAGKTNLDDIAKFLAGKNPQVQRQILREIGKTFGGKAMTFAGTNPIMRGAMRAVPGVTTALTALDVADVVAGNEGIGNKLVDAAAMTAGGVGGFLMGGGPLGAMVGASGAKALTDSLQRVTGMDNYSEEQRRMEEALAMINRGVV